MVFNILHELIKQEFEAKMWTSDEVLSIYLEEELEKLIYNELLDTSIEMFDNMEWDDDKEVTFYFTSSFNDMTQSWHHGKNCFAFISFHKDTNFEKPYIDRDWN